MHMPTASVSVIPRVLVVLVPALVGAGGLLTASTADRGSVLFYVATFFTAAVYVLAWWFEGRGRESFSRTAWGRDLARGAVLGLIFLAVFALGALVVRPFPVLADPVVSLLENVRQGALWLTVLTTAVNGVAEELFFRDVVPRNITGRPSVVAVCSVGLYTAVTIAMGVPLLVFAAVIIGGATYFEARSTRRLFSPIALHLVWSLGMLVVLPPLMGS